MVSTPKEENQVVAPAAPTGLGGTAGNGEVAIAWTAPADDGGAAIASYEVDIGIGGDWSEGPDPITGITETSRTVTELTNGATHDFRVRAVNSAGAGAWSEAVSLTPAAPATLILALPDLELANGAVHAIDMGEHFSGTGLSYEVMVTTTHKRTGEVKTAPINEVARNKVRGSWSGDVLTLTAGAEGHHVLGMEVIATDVAGGEARDDFQLTVGTSETESLAAEALKNTLASRARAMLEEASSTIAGRMSSGDGGSDALTAFAGLFGAGGSGGCSLDERLEECMTRDSPGRDARLFGGSGDAFGPLAFDWNREDEGGGSFGLSGLRERVRAQGFAVSLNRPSSETSAPLSPDGPAPGVALTFWGRGSAASGGSDTLFWGMDASLGEQWMTGLAFAESGETVTQSLSRGDARVSGLATSEVAAVYPYARARFGNGLSLWGLAGSGQGRVDSTWTGLSLDAALPEETIHLAGDLAFDLGLIGAEHVLHESGGLSLSAVGDAGWSQLAVESGTAGGIAASVSRTRLGLEARYAAPDGGWSSGLRGSARVDGGDGETGSGAELAGNVNRNRGRWQAGLDGHWYTAASGLGRHGIAVALALRPRDDGTGLAFALSPGWGTVAGQRGGLLAADDAGLTEEAQPLAHLGGRIAWGMRLPGAGRLTPQAELRLDQGGSHHLRAGLAFEGPVSLSLAADREETGSGPATHAIMLRLDTRF